MTERELWLFRALDRELNDDEREEKALFLQRMEREGVAPEDEAIVYPTGNWWIYGEVAIQDGVAGVKECVPGVGDVFYPVAHDVTGNIEAGRSCLAELTSRENRWFVKRIDLLSPREARESVIARWEKRFGKLG